MRRRRNFFWGGGFALNEAMCDLKQIANWSPQATTKVEKKPLKILKTEKLGGIVFFTFILVDILFSKRIQIYLEVCKSFIDYITYHKSMRYLEEWVTLNSRNRVALFDCFYF